MEDSKSNTNVEVIDETTESELYSYVSNFIKNTLKS